MAATVARVLDVARSQLGRVEPGVGNDDPGNQLTPYGTWYAAWSGQPAFRDTYWCAMFVSWVLATAGFTPTEAGRFGNCNPWIQWFKNQGRWGATPRPGAVVFFSWDGDARAEHVGIVESLRVDGRVVTLEGNATIPGRHDGVYRMVRSRGSIVGYGYPPYLSGYPGAGGPRPGYPTLVAGTGGPENTTGTQLWWTAQWFRLLARWAPGYYKRITGSAEGRAELARREVGPVTLAVSRDVARQLLGDELDWRGAITPQVWAIFPPVK